METATKRYAFISYNHKDQEMAKWLQAKLESYKLPTEIHNEFENSRYLRPVFRDKTDLNAGILSEELKKHLISSKYLVVVCSPNSAKSKWVNDEVKVFLEMGRAERIRSLWMAHRMEMKTSACLWRCGSLRAKMRFLA